MSTMDELEASILLKNDESPLPAACHSKQFINCKLVFKNSCRYTSTLLLGAADPQLRQLLEELPPYIEQLLLLPDYTDFNEFTQRRHQIPRESAKTVIRDDISDKDEEDDILEYKDDILDDKDDDLPLTCKIEAEGLETEEGSVDDQEYKAEKKSGGRKEGMGVGGNGFQYRCDSCMRRFKNILVLELHIRKVHDPTANINPYFEYLDNNEFRCKVCGFVNGSRNAIRKHCNKNHVKKKGIPCDQCGKEFCTDKELEYHMKSHNKEKSYFCPQCGEGFVYSPTLKRHYLREHATQEERLAAKSRFQCDICGFSDMFLTRLKRHMETHNTSKNYACDVCGKTFTSKRSIQQHHRRYHVLSHSEPKRKTAEQKARCAAKARVYRAIKAGKLPERFRRCPLPEVPLPGLNPPDTDPV